jgi:hypothetical protein
MPGRKIGIAIIIVFLFSTASFMSGMKKSMRQSSPAPWAAVRAAAPQTASAASNQETIEGLRLDLAKMEALVQQMEINLAHVESGQTFLKHQFQLEIDAWKVMIASMQRRLNAMEKK